ncbi:MAG TPA: GxxExxY protein [bacterium]
MDFVEPVEPFEEIDPETDKIAKEIVDAAYQVHLNLGPGLLENAYEICLVHEISQRGLKVEQQVAVPLNYKGVCMNVGFRLDLLVEGRVIVEIKAVEQLMPVHRAQVITYLKLSKNKLGFLINFNASILKKGLERIAFSKPKKL